MTTVTKKTIFRGDTPTFVFTVTDEDGVAVDLTSATVIKFIAKKSADQPDGDAQFNATCSVDAPATAGICRVKLSTTDTNKAGLFKAELMINFSSGATILTTLQFDLEIVADLHQATT